jgi:hypothetical protein
MTTKSDLRRYRLLQDMGCIVARLFYGAYRDADIHHITEGGRRLGNQFTIPLSPWLHRAVRDDGMSQEEMTATFGPSLAVSKRDFIARFGTERELLAKVNHHYNQRNRFHERSIN